MCECVCVCVCGSPCVSLSVCLSVWEHADAHCIGCAMSSSNARIVLLSTRDWYSGKCAALDINARIGFFLGP